jgi:hypothetical protein
VSFAGTPENISAGFGAVLPASQVNFDGMTPPALNSGLVMARVCADAEAPTRRTAAAVRMRFRIRQS